MHHSSTFQPILITRQFDNCYTPSYRDHVTGKGGGFIVDSFFRSCDIIALIYKRAIIKVTELRVFCSAF